MLQIFLKVFLIMAVLFAFAIPGFALKKMKMLGEGSLLALSNILLYVCQPALVIKAFCVFTKEQKEAVYSLGMLNLLADFGVAAAISLIAVLLVFGIAKLVFIKNRDKKAADVYTYAAIFSNNGFLGVPFIEMFTDGNPLAVMYIMVFNIVFNFLSWTLGVVLITGNVKDISVKKLLLNPTIIACFIGLILFFVPQINFFAVDGLEVLSMLPQYIAYMTAPLSMIIVGIRIAESSPKSLFLKKGVYAAGGLRLIVSPFLTLAVSVLFCLMVGGSAGALTGARQYVFLAPVIAMSMSPAASVVAMAERFDGDKEAATSVFVTNTLISVVVIPFIMMAVMASWGAFAG